MFFNFICKPKLFSKFHLFHVSSIYSFCVLQGLITGGTDSTTETLTWALSLILNNRETLKKAQDELDTHVGRERLADVSDLRKLVYIQALVKRHYDYVLPDHCQDHANSLKIKLLVDTMFLKAPG